MIKPTHYDDDGYPIQWFRSAIPSNTLAWMNALAEDARGRNVLGPDVEIRLHTYDETNRRVPPVCVAESKFCNICGLSRPPAIRRFSFLSLQSSCATTARASERVFEATKPQP